MSALQNLLEWAYFYIGLGLSVFPVIGKRPATAHGHKDASRDPVRLTQMFSDDRVTGVGIACGAASGGFVVIDADDGKGGVQSYASVAGLVPADAPRVVTGAGFHDYVLVPQGQPIPSRAIGVLPGLDILGEGGYVVAPPSLHPNGRLYTWPTAAPRSIPFASPSLLDWLHAARQKPTVASSSVAANTTAGTISQGQRNCILTSLAGTMRKRGMSPAAIESALVAENQAHCIPPLSDAEVKRIAASVSRYASNVGHNPTGTGYRPTTVAFSDVVPEKVEWLWEGRFPLGMPSVIDGDPGLGKSTLTLDLAARVSTGRPMPLEFQGSEPRNVIVISAEDSRSATIRPRLDAAGADVARICALTAVNGPDGERFPEFPAHLDALEQAIVENNAALVIIDPLMAYLGANVKSHNDQDVRRALGPLAAMAERTGAAILLVRHLNKSPGRSAIYRGGGSIGIAGAARSAMLVAADPNDNDARVLAPVKGNLAPAPLAIRFRVVSAGDVGRIEWLDAAPGVTADQLLSQPSEEHGALDEAVDVLQTILATGPVPTLDVIRQAKQAGVSERTARRAQKKLGVMSVRQGLGKNSHWRWALPPSAMQRQPPLGGAVRPTKQAKGNPA